MAVCLACAAVTAHGASAWARAVTPLPSSGGLGHADSAGNSDHMITAPLGPKGGTINWTSRRLCYESHSAGPIGAYLPPHAAPYAQRRAESLAQNGLITLLRTVVLGPPESPGRAPSTVGDALAADADLAAVVFSAVQNMQIYKSVYGADGSVTLQVMLPLDNEQPGLGALWAALQAKGTKSGLHPSARLPGHASAAKPIPRAEPQEVTHAATGIIINARGTGYLPSLWPHIVSSSGATLYGPLAVPIDVLILRGLMGTARSMEAAMSDARVAPVPVVLRAQTHLDQDPYTLVLAEDDAQAFRQQRALTGDARVICVVD